MGILSRLFGGGKQQKQPTLAVAMVMLRTPASFEQCDVEVLVQSSLSGVTAVLDGQRAESAYVARIPGGVIGLVMIPGPIPATELEGPIALAWHWPDAAGAVAAHAAHVVVHVMSNELDAIDARLLLSRVIARVLEATDALGVYVGDAMMVRAASDYLADTRDASREALPILSWIGFQLAPGDGGLSIYTTGMTAFGLLELEARNSSLPPPELLGTVADVAHYQLTSGMVLADGDTFGATQFDRTRVRYTRSEFLPDTAVALLELPSQ